MRLLTCAIGCLALILLPWGLAAQTTNRPANRLARVDARGVLRWQDDGSEVALFGVNYYTPFWHNYPDLKAVGADHKKVIDQDLAHFARLGLDVLRLHVFDREISDRAGNLIENEHLELLDYLVAQAKGRGIYTVLTPIAWWGVPGESPGFSTGFTMPQMTTDRASWGPQTNYTARFVRHVNRFTGLSFKEDPAVIAFELINEPLYPEGTSDAKVMDYINALADALRGTGCRKPLFYNCWQHHLAAVAQARVDGATFGWYPSGLAAGHSLTRNFLPVVNEYGGDNPWNPSMRDEALARKAKIVYEFDAADIPGSYMYPAMARSFRSGGAQMAAQFQYDPLPLALFNQGWQTHFLNLSCAPQKAVSFLIAAEAFRRLPRLQDYGPYPKSCRFGPCRVSYEEDLSELVTEEDFFYSNSTRTQPPAPAKLTRLIGCGSSPVVRYPGTGAYFLERMGDGVWRLEVHPDAVWVNDPYGAHRMDREVARILWREWPMEIHLPNLVGDFSMEPLNERNTHRAVARDGKFAVRPGVYRLRRNDLRSEVAAKMAWTGRVGLGEFVSLPHQESPPVVRHDARSQWVEGRPLPVNFTVVTGQEPDLVKVVRVGLGELAETPLRRDRAYCYAGSLPVEWTKAGQLTYSLVVNIGGRNLIFPTNGPRDWEVTLHSSNAPAPLFEAGRHPIRVEGGAARQQQRVNGMTEGSKAWRITVPTFGAPPNAVNFRNEIGQELDPWRELLTRRTALRIRARALEKSTTTLELVLVEQDGAVWGANIPLTTEWRDARLPISALRHFGHWAGNPPGRGGPGDRLRPEEISAVNVCFGAWLYPGHANEPHGIEVESVAVE